MDENLAGETREINNPEPKSSEHQDLRSEKLKSFYDNVYSGEKNSHFLKYRDGKKIGSVHELAIQWMAKHLDRPKSILDFGSGEGDFLGAVEGFTTRVGLDFSEVALANAKKKYPEVEGRVGDERHLKNTDEQWDVVSSFGTLEHTEKPHELFELLASKVKKDGALIVSCPSFLNVRGVIWMTLSELFAVPMSLSDRHFLTPSDFSRFSASLPLKLELMTSVDHDVAQGDAFRSDMTKRLKNALRDAKMDNSRVDNLIHWFESNKAYFAQNEFSGAEMLFVYRKQ